MAFTSNAQRQKNLETLRLYLEAKPDGSILSWVEVEQQSGVSMRERSNRALVTLALKKLKRPYSSIHGSGIELSGPRNAANQAENSSRRAFRGLKRASKNVDRIGALHLERMPPEDQQRLLAQRSILGALASAGKTSKRLAAKHDSPPTADDVAMRLVK